MAQPIPSIMLIMSCIVLSLGHVGCRICANRADRIAAAFTTA
jgi:hypothetical protein